MFLIAFAVGCRGIKKNEIDSPADPGQAMVQTGNYNITILLDLSDRISAEKNPGQAARDIAAVMAVVDVLKRSLATKGTIDSRDKIRVVFYPNNYNPMVQDIASALNVDFEQLTPPQRRSKYEQLDSVYRSNLSSLYAMASSAPIFNGSDIFSYFHHRITDDCISSDSSFINVLVVFSDGYMYHKNSCYQSGNRYSYIVPEAKHIDMFRKDYNWKTRFEKEDYGFIAPEVDLSGLKILALEFAPWGVHTSDFDIMLGYWAKWFEEMNVEEGDYKIVKTDVPALNKNVIEEFFRKVRE